MPFDFKNAASNMIDAGATDDEIKTVIGGMKDYAGQLIDEGKSNQEIEHLIGQTKWKDQPVFTSKVTPETKATAAGVKAASPVRLPIAGGIEYTPTREDIQRGRDIGAVAMPLVGGAVGGALPIPGGAVIGSMAGTAGAQALGLEEPSIGGVLASGAGAAIPTAVGKLATSPAVTSKFSKIAELIPGVSRLKLNKAASTILDDVDDLIKTGDSKALWTGFKNSGGVAIKDTPAIKAAIADIKDEIAPLSKKFPGAGKLRNLVAAIEEKLGSNKPIDLLDLDKHIKATGKLIGSLERQGGTELGASKHFLRAMYEDLENAPLTMTVGSGQAQAATMLRKAAVNATKRSANKDELLETITGSIKSVGGEGDMLTIRPDAVLNRIRALITPQSKSFDPSFADALKEELPQVISIFNKLNKLSQSGAKPGSLVVQGMLAAGGGSIGHAVAGAPGLVAGSIAGTMVPTMVARIVESPAGRAVLDKGLDAAISSGNKAALSNVFQLAFQMARRFATAPAEQEQE